MKLDNKVVLITGGAGEIGEAIGRIFLEKGAKVCLCDVNVVEGGKILQKFSEDFGPKRIIFSKCDVTKDEDFEGAYNECEKHFGPLDILINNAAVNSKDVNATMAVNFFGVVRGTELAMKKMGKHNGGKGGHVVNVASVLGLAQFPCMPYYSSSKASTVQFSRCMGDEFNYNYSGVSVLCLCPGMVDTSFSSLESNLRGSINSFTDENLREMIPKLTSKLMPMEVAETLLQLLEENKTGSVLAVEKGLKPYYVLPQMNYKVKNILITGGAGGIGQAMAKTFLEKEAKVCICDINEVRGNEVLKELQNIFGHKNIMFVMCDVTKDDDFIAVYNECEKEFGSVDILINNAGVFSKSLKTTMEVNFESVVRGTELALKRMGKHNGGNGGFVVNVGSNLGAARAPFYPYYASSKAAVIHYTRCIGHEFHYDYSGVHILCLCPSATETPLVTLENSLKGSYNSFTDKMVVESISSLKMLTPKEVAEAAIQLISDKKPGAALLIEKDVSPYYVLPSVLKEF